MAEANANARRREQVSSSPISQFIHWLQVKNYQYEVTTSLYMLTSTEKIVFNSILFVLISLLVTAAYLYLPAHMLIIYTRVWYYISGEFTNHHSAGSSNVNVVDGIVESLKTTSYLAKQTLGAAGSVWKDEI